MKLWLTAPYDPDGIEEVEITWGPDENGHFGGGDGICRSWASLGWYEEGETFHRTREAALEKAKEHRANWIVKTTQEAARIAALPALSA